MDPSVGKGSAPIRDLIHQTQSPLYPKDREIEDVSPLSDTRLDQSTTLPFETLSGRPVNNCARPYSSWPAQVTITPVPLCNIYAQPPNCPSNSSTPASVIPQMCLATPPENGNINPNLLFGSQQVNPQPQQCQVLTANCTPTVDCTSNPQFNVIQPLCYGPVSEGHYVVLQPVCCYFTKEPSEKGSEGKAVLEKAEVEKEKSDNSNKVETKKNTKRKNKANRKARGQNGKHNSAGVVRSRLFSFRAPSSVTTVFTDNSRSRFMKHKQTEEVMSKQPLDKTSALDEDDSKDFPNFYDLHTSISNRQ